MGFLTDYTSSLQVNRRRVVTSVNNRAPTRSNHTRTDSRTRYNSVSRKRAGSASDTERSEPMVRRKLGEVTRKFENLDVKHNALRQVGIKEAEQNFDALRSQSDERTKGM